MKQNTYVKVSGLVFALVAIAHAVRAYNSWELHINNMVLPVWISWVVVVFLAFMCYQAFKVK